MQTMFAELFNAKSESEVDSVLNKNAKILQVSLDWFPLGGNESNFGVIENQQSNPIAAIVEKLTNSIDAILMRRCHEEGIDPRGPNAPRSVEEAVETFFPARKNWDLSQIRNQQAENIQIIGDSRPNQTSDTSLIIYDNGEGQHPEDFEDTFLSLLRGNKNEIHFVQGKYNMGGSGAIVFCGKQRYQLIASKRHDGSGLFGFTMIRKHRLTRSEANTKKNTWYEYLKIDGEIPAFPIDELDLKLHNRCFRTGTVIKLYSYDLKGNRHVRRDLGRSLNEFLYAPALPIYTVETEERYPKDRALTGVIFGLKRRLQDSTDYVEETLSETYIDRQIGRMNVTVHVFQARAKGRTAKATRKTIQDEFFKNNMAVLFSVNGQVHGHYTSEFITRSLKFNLLKDHLLIHVDCTDMNLDFRNELFMASRDRLKQGEESSTLRRVLADNLKGGQLQEIYKRRKDMISVDAEEDDDLLRSFAENLPISNELRGLLSQTFKLDQEDKPPKQSRSRRTNSTKLQDKELFNFKRFPSFFKLDTKANKNGRPLISIPANGSKTIKFSTDVENQYFDRSEDPGDMKIAVMSYMPNDNTGGDQKGSVNDIRDVLSVTRRSPNEGSIRVVLKPTEELQVGDEIEIQVDLTSPGKDFTERFWVKISEPSPTKQHNVNKPGDEKIGLPKHVLVYQQASQDSNFMTWEQLDEQGIEMDWDTVMHPHLDNDILDTIYINMDCRVLKKYKSSIRNLTTEQSQVADRRYISSVYFHTLFLYVINRQRCYEISRSQGDQRDDVELEDYLKDVFSSHYAAFLLNFGIGELVNALG